MMKMRQSHLVFRQTNFPAFLMFSRVKSPYHTT